MRMMTTTGQALSFGRRQITTALGRQFSDNPTAAFTHSIVNLDIARTGATYNSPSLDAHRGLGVNVEQGG